MTLLIALLLLDHMDLLTFWNVLGVCVLWLLHHMARE